MASTRRSGSAPQSSAGPRRHRAQHHVEYGVEVSGDTKGTISLDELKQQLGL
jgi:hypothetical protein